MIARVSALEALAEGAVEVVDLSHPLEEQTPVIELPEPFAVWLIWNNVGDKEPLTFDPVNWWTGLLLLAIAIDLGGGHAHGARR